MEESENTNEDLLVAIFKNHNISIIEGHIRYLDAFENPSLKNKRNDISFVLDDFEEFPALVEGHSPDVGKEKQKSKQEQNKKSKKKEFKYEELKEEQKISMIQTQLKKDGPIPIPNAYRAFTVGLYELDHLNLFFKPLFLSEQIIDIPIMDTRIKTILKKETLTFRYKDYLSSVFCVMGCKSHPHSDYELMKFERVARQVEFYLSDTNLDYNKFIRDRMDPEGWIKCYVLHELPKIHYLNVTLDLFVLAVEHSLHLRVSNDRKFVRSIYDPLRWRYHYVFSKHDIPHQSPPFLISDYSTKIYQDSLRIHGIHQMIAEDYNKIINCYLEKFNLPPRSYSLCYSPHVNVNDIHRQFHYPYPLLSKQRNFNDEIIIQAKKAMDLSKK